MITPVIRCLQKQLKATIHVATKKAFVSLLEDNPYIEKVFGLEDDWKAFVKPMKSEHYDHVIDLHNNLRSKRLARSLGIKGRRYDKLSIHKEALIRFRINNLPNLHVSERGLDTVKYLGVKNDHEGMDFFIPNTVQIAPEWQTKTFVTLALATAHNTKNIPFQTLQLIAEHSDLPIILLGGPAEKELGNSLSALFPDKLVNMAGNCSLLESAAYVNSSKYLIAGDTGLMHIAAALKKPTLSIWGATIPEFGVFPYYGKYNIPHFMHEVSLSCRPCSKHGGKKCPKKHFNCMNLQDIDSIFDHMNVLAL